MKDQRRQLAEQWAAEQLGWAAFSSQPISSDASFRRYFRLRSNDKSIVVMDAPPEKEPVAAFLDVASRLEQLVHIPTVIAADRDRGLIALSDLGDQPFHRALSEENAERLFDDALNVLVRMQAGVNTENLPAYEPAKLLAEMSLFVEWFLARHWQVEPSEAELDDWDEICALLLRWALDQPQVFCHRDYMPRNLMVGDPNPAIIDFQDAVIGPISYDPVCLFRDAFLSWRPEQVDDWLEKYRQMASSAGLPITESPSLWRKSCDLMGVQRHLKVIGIFARICYRDGKPAYLQDHPRFFGYLSNAISRNPELALLQRLIDSWQARARPRSN